MNRSWGSAWRKIVKVSDTADSDTTRKALVLSQKRKEAAWVVVEAYTERRILGSSMR